MNYPWERGKQSPRCVSTKGLLQWTSAGERRAGTSPPGREILTTPGVSPQLPQQRTRVSLNISLDLGINDFSLDSFYTRTNILLITTRDYGTTTHKLILEWHQDVDEG